MSVFVCVVLFSYYVIDVPCKWGVKF